MGEPLPQVAVSAGEPEVGAPLTELTPEGSAPRPYPDSTREMFLPVGVKDDQDPTYVAYLTPDQRATYRGFAVPFNLAANLLAANELALKAQVRFSAITGAAGRLIKMYGPDKAKKILSGNGNEEEKIYFERLLELERMMDCYLRAIKEVLGVETFKGVLSSLREMQNVEAFSDDVLQAVSIFRGKMGSQDTFSFFGTETTVRSALRNALPKETRENPTLQINGGGISPELQREFDYPATNAGMKKHLIEKRNGSVICHVGSDRVKIGGDSRSTNECLREVAGRNLGILDYEKLWLVEKSLDGGAFSARSSGQTQRVVPYYLELNDINPEEELPLRLPALPHVGGWVGSNMRRDDGGGLGGPALDYVKRWVGPVAATYMRARGDKTEQLERQLRFANDMNGQVRGPKLKSLVGWADAPEVGGSMPEAFEGTGELGDLIRIINTHIAEVFAANLAASTPQ